MFDHGEFLATGKCMLITPAGFGKTHAIAECLLRAPVEKCYLVLTHTHAGIDSIREKMKKQGVSSSKNNIETITGFAQKYVLAFYLGNDIPNRSNSGEYFSFIVKKATELFKYPAIKRIVSETYEGLFVDEYQDCTENQHNLIMRLAESLKIYIFGDYMQGIFGFREKLVDLEDSTVFSSYKRYELNTPWRWINGNNPDLGDDLLTIRQNLRDTGIICLTKYKSIEFFNCMENDLHKNPSSLYYKTISGLLSQKSLLVIHPVSTSMHPRIKIIQKFNNRLSLVESIDDKDFYLLSNEIDSITTNDVSKGIRNIAYKLFNKSGLDNWFNNNGFKNKRDKQETEKVDELKYLISTLADKINFPTISIILKKICKLNNVKCYRRELFYNLCRAIEDAEVKNVSVLKSMEESRNRIRRTGRKIFGKCIGTTLLTKGLEFETVVVLDAHKFVCPKHLYVALTRASKRLIVFSEKAELTFS